MDVHILVGQVSAHYYILHLNIAHERSEVNCCYILHSKHVKARKKIQKPVGESKKNRLGYRKDWGVSCERIPENWIRRRRMEELTT